MTLRKQANQTGEEHKATYQRQSMLSVKCDNEETNMDESTNTESFYNSSTADNENINN